MYDCCENEGVQRPRAPDQNVVDSPCVKERYSYHDHTPAKLIARDRSPDIRTAKLSFSTAKNSEYQRDLPDPFAVVPSVPTNYILRLYVGVNSASSADSNSACDLSLAIEHNLYSSREQKLIVNLYATRKAQTLIKWPLSSVNWGLLSARV
jgi:hypothetical protein